MQGILKSNHQRLCECLQDVKETESFADSNLSELEKELQAVFQSYQEKMKELKRLILSYDEKQKIIRNEIKRIRKQKPNLQDSKKSDYFAMGKAVVFIYFILQRFLVFISTEIDISAFYQC